MSFVKKVIKWNMKDKARGLLTLSIAETFLDQVWSCYTTNLSFVKNSTKLEFEAYEKGVISQLIHLLEEQFNLHILMCRYKILHQIWMIYSKMIQFINKICSPFFSKKEKKRLQLGQLTCVINMHIAYDLLNLI